MACLKPYSEPLGPQPSTDEIDVLRAHMTLIRWLLCPRIPIILDIKGLADTKRTNKKTLAYAFDVVGADAVTVNPVYGTDQFEPFLEKYSDNYFFLLCYPSVSESVFHARLASGYFLWEHIALSAKALNGCYGNVGLVVGANAPPEVMRRVRELAGDDVVMLMPGLGAQGGSVAQAVRYGSASAKESNIIFCAGDSVVHAVRGRGYEVAAREAAAAYVKKIAAALKRLEAKKS